MCRTSPSRSTRRRTTIRLPIARFVVPECRSRPSEMEVRLAPARREDVSVILELIKGLADYERLAHEVTATAADIDAGLFGPAPAAEVVLAWAGDEAIGFALFFHNYSTFLGRRGLYLE